MSERKEIERRIESIEGLVHEIEQAPDPAFRSISKQLVQSLMDLHGSGFERMLEIIHRTGKSGQTIMDELCRDDLVRSLLLLYDLHPLGLQERVVGALEKVRPYLRSHGGNVQLVAVSDSAVVTLKLEGSCHSCPSSAITLQSTVEQAIYEAAPDVSAIIVEGVVREASATGAFVPLGALQGESRDGTLGRMVRNETDWKDVVGLDGIPPGTLRKQAVGGRDLLFCNLNEDFYAYGITCPGCGQPLAEGHLEDAILICPICRQRYDLVHAGRGIDVSTLHLEPIPLLRENGRAKVAIISHVQRSAT